MLLIDPASGAVIDANDAAAKFYGYTRDALRSTAIQQINLLPPEEIAQRRLQVLEDQGDVFEFPHRLADGRGPHRGGPLIAGQYRRTGAAFFHYSRYYRTQTGRACHARERGRSGALHRKRTRRHRHARHPDAIHCGKPALVRGLRSAKKGHRWPRSLSRSSRKFRSAGKRSTGAALPAPWRSATTTRSPGRTAMLTG